MNSGYIHIYIYVFKKAAWCGLFKNNVFICIYYYNHYSESQILLGEVYTVAKEDIGVSCPLHGAAVFIGQISSALALQMCPEK